MIGLAVYGIGGKRGVRVDVWSSGRSPRSNMGYLGSKIQSLFRIWLRLFVSLCRPLGQELPIFKSLEVFPFKGSARFFCKGRC